MEKVKREEANVDTKKEVTVASSSSVSESSCETVVPKLSSVKGRTTGPTRRSTKGGWTENEDGILTKAVKIYNGKNWKKIAEFFPGRTDVQCLHRWQKVLNPELVKGPWTKEEDDRIIELVEKYGSKKWSVISKSLPGRIGKQCRERWHNHLNPAIKKDAWTKEEELALIRAHQIYGNKWAEIARFLPGRADNSIKNHWNCSVKKKLDAYSDCGSVGDLCSITFPDFENHETKARCIKAEMVRQSPDTIVSLDQKMDLEGGVETPLQGSVIGNANGSLRHLQLQPVQNPQIEIEHCSSSKEEVNGLTKPPNGTQYNEEDATINGLTSEHCGDNACMTDDSHRGSPIHPEVSCGTSSTFSVKVHSNKYTHEPGDCTSLSAPPNPPEHVTLSASLNVYLDVSGGTRRNNIPSEMVLPVTAKRSLEYPKRPQHHAFSMNGLVITDSRFNGEYNNKMPTCDFDGDEGQVGKQNEVPRTSLHLEDINFDRLCYEPPQLKDLNVALANGIFSSTDNNIQHANGPFHCSTPPSHVRGIPVNSNSPEYMLRIAAKSFRTTPSIIRKRGRETPRQDSNASDSDGICTPEVRTNNSNNVQGSTHYSYLHDHDGRDDLNSTDLLNVKRLFLSSPTSLNSEASAAVKSVEKRLEYAFDMEWDCTKAKRSASATESDSSDANHVANTMLISLGNTCESMRVGSGLS